MLYEQPLFLFDVAAVTMMLVFAYLSKRLGEAMRIRPYYIIFFVTASAVVGASGLETIPRAQLNYGGVTLVANAVRFAASAIAFFVALRYWKWLFTEYSKKQGGEG